MGPLQPTKRSEIIDALTGFRAVAAILVFWHHMLPEWQTEYPINIIGVLREGHIGVTLFFVLSGFLITYRYAASYKCSRTWFYAYFVNRIARIYPVFITLVTIQMLYSREPILTWLLNISLLKGFSRDYLFTGLAQSWSLTVEEMFYFSVPILFGLLTRNRLIVLLGSAAGLLVLGLSLSGLREISLESGWKYAPTLWGDQTFVLNYTFLGRSFEFFVGMYAALLLAEGRFKSGTFPYRTIIGSLGILISMTLLASVAPAKGFGVNTVPGSMINNYLLPVAVATLILGLIKEDSIAKRILSSKILIAAGKSSYAFYLLHVGCFWTLINLLGIELNIKLWIVVSIWFFVCWGLSFLVYTVIEHPANSWIKGRLLPKP